MSRLLKGLEMVATLVDTIALCVGSERWGAVTSSLTSRDLSRAVLQRIDFLELAELFKFSFSHGCLPALHQFSHSSSMSEITMASSPFSL